MQSTAHADEKKPNHLITEKSPYLIQHAYNPVDWYPWGDEAFKKAREENKPIFLSIGYSTCHWCHVMEHESFEDPGIAQYLNEHFVSIKVDREERPDIDQIYMSYVISATGSGGWPMTVFMGADKKPFFGGTYFAPAEAHGRPSFKRVLEFIENAWRTKQDQIKTSGDQFIDYLRDRSSVALPDGGKLPDEGVLTSAFRSFYSGYDGVHGGFGRAPKFPSAHNLLFILRYYNRSGDEDAFSMVETTLKKMAQGGMRDQIGGGFHRYSVDREWFVPHFEKMLYDQAMLLRAYTEMYQMTQDPAYSKVAREICEYVLRDMTDAAGGFYSAEDADSLESSAAAHKREGAFYVWRADEMRALLTEKEFKVASLLYGVEEAGNVTPAQDPMKEFTGVNILKLARTAEEAARELEIGTPEVEALIQSANSKLFAARGKRPRPHLDDKILTDWNGLMIAHLTAASQALGEPRYLAAAEKAMDFVLKHCVDADGRLLHRYRAGEAAIAGQLDDYAFLTYGLLELYLATGREKYLGLAQSHADRILLDFRDAAGPGGFFMTTEAGSSDLISRPKDLTDGALPSGNSIAVLDLVILETIRRDGKYGAAADRELKFLSTQWTESPTAFGQALSSLDFWLGPQSEVVIAGDPGSETARAMKKEIYLRFLPHTVVLNHPEGSMGKLIEVLVPWIHEQPAVPGKVTAYVCHDGACQLPTSDLNQFRRQLDELN
jgi:hypothetical protein